MGFDTPRTSSEINDVRNTASENIDEGTSVYPGMSYEEGVEAALSWIAGDSDENPFEEN